jgi:hypothetical protein
MTSDLIRTMLLNTAINPAFLVTIQLAEMGYRCLPTDMWKIPKIVEWQLRATTDIELLVQWERGYFAPWKIEEAHPNWSILTGRENGVIVIDIDGEQGRADLKKLEDRFGPLPTTWRCNSGRVDGGFHIWMRPPPGTDDLKNQQPIPGFKLDVRGYHGHIVLSGSLHRSGSRYAWAPGCSPDEIDLAECPPAWWEWLPKKGDEHSSPPRKSGPRTSQVQHHHDHASLLIGDGNGYGGFQNPIYKNAIRYFFKAGPGADAGPAITVLREMITAAPKDQSRDVSRYFSGPDLPRIVERARRFVNSLEE